MLTMRRPLALTGFAFGLAILALQLSLTLPASMEAGRSFLGSLVFYFSYFTILTNILVVLVYAAVAFPAPWLAAFRRAGVRAVAAAAIAFVMIFYHLLLLNIWQPEGLWLVCDIALHYVAPLAYLAFWAIFLADGTLRLRQLPLWLIYPAAYLAYALARGALVGEYPYHVLDPRPDGWPPVVIGLIWLFAAYAALGLAAIGFDTLKKRLPRPA